MIPNNVEEVCVCSHDIQCEDEIDDEKDVEANDNKFRFLLTTKRLINRQ